MNMDDLPRYTVAVQFTQAELDRIDEMCSIVMKDTREQIIHNALVAYDRLLKNTDDSVFLRRG
jgi:hypothetical protein